MPPGSPATAQQMTTVAAGLLQALHLRQIPLMLAQIHRAASGRLAGSAKPDPGTAVAGACRAPARSLPPSRPVLRLVRTACVALPVVVPGVSQQVISLSLDESGQPVLPPAAVVDTAYVIDTIAGTGQRGFGGDGGPASEAQFNHPGGLALDAAGNVYVADTNNNRVRRIDVAGIVTTIAGNGVRGSTGDGGPATDAQLDFPRALALDAEGNLYVAETGGNRVRRVDSSGTIATIAGTGAEGSGGDGGLATEAQLNQPSALAVDTGGNVYVAEYGGFRIRKIAVAGTITTLGGNGVQGYGGDGGPATDAQLNFVAGLVADAGGNVYLADMNEVRVRRIDPSGTITTVVGRGTPGWSGDGGPATAAEIRTPAGVALDAAGTLFLTEYWVGRIRKVGPSGIITTIAGTSEQRSGGDMGWALDAALDRPAGIAVDSGGSLYVTESFGQRVRILRPRGQQARIPVGLGASGDVVWLAVAPSGILRLDGQPVASGLEVSADNGETYSISRTEAGAVAATHVPQRQSVPLKDGLSVSLWKDETGDWRVGSAVVRNGYRHVEDGEEYLLEWTGLRWRLAEYTIRTVAGTVDVADGIAATSSTLFNPSGVAIDSSGNVYVADTSNHRVRKVDSAGVITTLAGTGERGSSGDGGSAARAELHHPKGIAVSSVGEIFVVDSGNDRVRAIDQLGEISTAPNRARLFRPHGVASDSAGSLYLTDEDIRNHMVWRVGPTGRATVLAGVPGERGGYLEGASGGEARLYYPRGIALDAAGNAYVADSWNHRVRKVDASGGVTTIAGTGERGFAGDGGLAVEASLRYPGDVQLDDEGNVYVSDSSNHRVRRIDADGIIETIAGTGVRGYSGDGGLAAEAQLAFPRGIRVTSSGDIYIAESGNDRVRKIDAAGVITTIAGSGLPFERRDGGPAAAAQFGYPYGIATDSVGNAYVVDSNRVRKIGSHGIISTIAGTGELGFGGDGGPALEALLERPRAVAVDAAGNVYVGGLDSRVRRIDSAGTIMTIAGTGESGFGGDGGPAVEAQLDEPLAIAVDSTGNVYVADYRNHRVRRIDASGVISTFAGTGVPDTSDEYGYELSPGDEPSDSFPSLDGSAPAAQARLTNPFGVAVDGLDNVYVADRGNRFASEARIGVIGASALERQIAPLQLGAAVPRFSTGFAIGAEGAVYVSYNGTVLKFLADGAASKIAGGGEGRAAAQGEPAAGVAMGRFMRIGLDATGSIWVADSSNRRIHVLEPVPQ